MITEYEGDSDIFGDFWLIHVIEEIEKVGAGRNKSCQETRVRLFALLFRSRHPPFGEDLGDEEINDEEIDHATQVYGAQLK